MPTTAPFSPEAQDYFDRLDTAGDTTYVDYKQPLANYIDSLVALGGAYWDDMGSAASFVGVGIQGVTVPLKSTMTALTNNNFVAGDLDQLTGLKGDASTKYLDTGSKFNDFPQNDFSMSCNITEFIQETTDGNYLAYQSFGDGVSQISTQNDAGVNPNNLITRCNTRNAKINFDLGSLEDLYGINRTVSTEYSVQYGASSTTVTEPSQAPANQIMSILGASTEAKSNARMATYHIGPALNLATLEGLQATLLSEIRTAHTFVAAASYFSRLAAAGDTTHVAYKQPLTNYITSLVELGGAYWDTMESSTSFVGVGIQGVTVPLRDGMTVPTQNNFVAADLSQLTGLKGNGSTKDIATGITTDDAGTLNDVSISTYLTEQSATPSNRAFIGTQGLTIRETSIVNEVNTKSRNYNSQTTAATSILGFIGHSRSANNSYTLRLDGSSAALIQFTTVVPPTELTLFQDSTAGNRTDARLATYHIGPAIDLATLEGCKTP